MSRRLAAAALLVACAATPALEGRGQDSRKLSAAGMGEVTVYSPAGPPRQVVLFLSGDGGWNLGVVAMAKRLRDEGALVVGIDIRRILRRLDAASPCGYPAGTLEELSRAVQLRLKLPAYKRPILVGYSSGATLVYAAIAAAPPESFAGAVSLGFCPDLEVRAPLCQMRGLKATRKTRGVGYDLAPYAGSRVPWMVLQGENDKVCASGITRTFVASTGDARLFSLPKVGHGFGVPTNWQRQFVEAYHAIADARSVHHVEPVSTPAVADLSLVEVAPTATGHDDTMAVMLTGDGGWAEIDKSVAAGLSAAGIPVVGWSSLDYYWSPRTPAGATEDLARIIDYYATAWRRGRVIVVGYSFGADVAPFLVNRLRERDKSRVAGVALLAPSKTAAFEFHLAEWLGGAGDSQYPTGPEIERLDVPVTCVSSADETDSPCRAAANPRLRAETLGHGHHFGGDYERLVEMILHHIR